MVPAALCSAGNSSRRHSGHSQYVQCCAYSPDRRRIVTASLDATLKVWDADTGRELMSMSGHTGEITSCAFSPAHPRNLSASKDKTLRLWDANSGRELLVLAGHSDWIEACAYSPDGQQIASGSVDKTVRLWSATTGQLIAELEGHSWRIFDLAYSPDGRLLVSGSSPEMKIWDAATGKNVATIDTGAIVKRCYISPDGRRILTSSDWSGFYPASDEIMGPGDPNQDRGCAWQRVFKTSLGVFARWSNDRDRFCLRKDLLDFCSYGRVDRDD